MNKLLNIVVATGLGNEVGNYFFSSLRSALVVQFSSARLVARFVDVNDILPVLRDSKRVAEIMLHALLSPRYPVPNLVLIPCNSVHIASPYLKSAFYDSFVPIDEAVMSLIGREGRKGRFLILGTSTTLESGMYQEGLRRLDCELLTLPPKAQAELDDFIFNDLVNGKMDTSYLNILRELEHRYMELLKADHVILACTELCYLVQVFSQPLACEVDSLQALHDAGIERLQAHMKNEPVYAY
ncbi:MAG: aspartate/glutamate racemase family protein [Candidatus Nitrotoga sp.]